MKKFYLFIILGFLCNEVFANDSANLGILSDIAERAPKSPLSNSDLDFSNRVVADIAFDNSYQSTNRRDEFKEMQGGIRFFSTLSVKKNFQLNSYIRAKKQDNTSTLQKRNNSLNGGGDRTFENMAIFINELNLSYRVKNYAIVAGKFNLNFGNAWRWDRGIWIHDIANNYREREKLGLGGVLHVGDNHKTGQYSFGFATFTNDNKNLDNSVLNKRDSTSKSDGAPGDKKGLSSYLATLDVNFDFDERFGVKERLVYHFSYINLAVNERVSKVTPTKIDDQKGFALGMNYKYPVYKNLLFDGLVEYAQIKNLDGNSDIGEDYLTANLITRFYRNWNILLGYAERRQFEIDQNGFDQRLFEVSLGYEFAKNSFFDKLTLQGGYKNQRIDYKTSINSQNVYGVLVRYYKNF